MGILTRIADFLYFLDGHSGYSPDPERDTNRIRRFVDDHRHTGRVILRVNDVWEHLHDGLWHVHARPIGLPVSAGGIDQRDWVYERLLDLAADGRLVEDPENGGPYGQFWHTSNPIARMINASTEFRIAMGMTRDQLEAEGHSPLVEILDRGQEVMDEVKSQAKEHSLRTGFHKRGEASTHFPVFGAPDESGRNCAACICGWKGEYVLASADELAAAWRRHSPNAR